MKKVIPIAFACLLFAGCSGDSDSGSTPPASSPAPAPTAAPAAPAPATPAPAAPEVAPAAAPTAAAGTLPAECEAYLQRATACFDKANQANPGSADAVRQGLDQTRAAWEQVADKNSLTDACKQMNDAFAQTASALQCE